MLSRLVFCLPLLAVLTDCTGSNAPDAGLDVVDARDAPRMDALPDTTDAPVSRGQTVSATNLAGTVSIAADGTVEIDSPAGLPVLVGARADVLLATSTVPQLVRASSCTVSMLDPSAVPALADTALTASRVTLLMSCQPTSTLALNLYVQVHQGSSAVTARLDILPSSAIQVLRASAFAVQPGGGALFVAGAVDDDRILDDGSLLVGDSTVRLYDGTHSREILASISPIPLRGDIIANANLGLHDLTSGAGLAAGALTTERGFTLVGLGSSPGAPVRVDGAIGYDTFAPDAVYIPNGKPVSAGQDLWSEMLYLGTAETNGRVALEHYADAVAVQGHITPWHARSVVAPVGNEGRHVPTAWQSWCLGFMGGYAHAISTSIIHQNVDEAALDFEPYGFDIVPIDDGWELLWGDWTMNPANFPETWSDETTYANAEGIGGGFWIAPFGVDPTSTTATMHPDWIATPDPTLGSILLQPGTAVLDLARDDVIARVQQVAHDMNAAGLAWYKQDFAYRELAAIPSDPTMTAVEAYRRGFAAVRSETPDATLLVAVEIFAPNFGVMDAIRTGLDNGGRWDELPTDPDSPTASTRAFKTTVRTATRRYYLNDRVTLLDPDAIPFRSMDTPATIGDTEERTFAVYLGMLGGVLEVGDPLVGMRPFAQDTVRMLTPLYGRSAEPLDVFFRDYNERWVLPVVAWSTDAAAPVPWVVVAATNWGTNRDFSVQPFAAITDGPRQYTFTRDEIGLGTARLVGVERWSGTFVSLDSGSLEFMVAPHDSGVYVLHPYRAGVQLLASDRHLTGGAPDVTSETWTASTNAYQLSLHVVAAGSGGRTTPLTIYLHADPTIAGIPTVMLTGATASDLTVSRTGEMVTISFTPTASATATVQVQF